VCIFSLQDKIILEEKIYTLNVEVVFLDDLEDVGELSLSLSSATFSHFSYLITSVVPHYKNGTV